ncbi:MAG: hypothetical protein MUP81_06500, partial [Dehalococcoidia bacterium]|nr:hypothetical protein [Dehalococcoidia bacterium]
GGGGGGGAGGVGSTGDGEFGGAGGAGIASSISGFSVTYAVGGAGGVSETGTGVAGSAGIVIIRCLTADFMEANIGFHTATAQRRYKAATFSTFTFPDPAGTGFTPATDGYSMLSGWGLVGVFQMMLSGTLHASGTVGRTMRKSLEGSLTSSGILSITQRFYKVLYGTVNFSGTLSGLRIVILGGVLNLSGSLNRLIKKGLSGTLNLTGVLQGGITFFKSLAGTLNFSGVLASVYRFSKALAGTLNLSGSLIKLVKKNLVGTLNSSGTLGRKIWHKLSGTLNLSGALGYGMPLYHKVLAGTLNLSGSLNRKIRKSLSGTISFIGTLTKFFATLFLHRYVIEIHDTSGALLAVLKNAYGISLEETVNVPKTLTFDSPADDTKLALVTRTNEIWVRDVKTNTVIMKGRLLRDDDTR